MSKYEKLVANGRAGKVYVGETYRPFEALSFLVDIPPREWPTMTIHGYR